MNTNSISEISDETRSLFADYRKLHERILKTQEQIADIEASYLDETPYGNIVRGWEGYIDTKQSRKELNTMKYKNKPYAELDYMFSNSSAYASYGPEPDWSLVDPWNLDTTMAVKSARQITCNTKSKTSSDKNDIVATSGIDTSNSGTLRRKVSLQSIAGAMQTQEVVGVAPAACKLSATSADKETRTASMVPLHESIHNNSSMEADKSKKRKREKQAESQKESSVEGLPTPVSTSLSTDAKSGESNSVSTTTEQSSLETLNIVPK